VPAVEPYLHCVNAWCIDDMLLFRESCRREGRVWATSGYSFRTGKSENDSEFNKYLYKNVVNLAKYLHFYSGKKVSPFALIIPHILNVS